MSATKYRIMYIQRGWSAGRIGRVRISKSGRTLFYGATELIAAAGVGAKANYLDPATGETYWISGPRKDGQDTLYPGLVTIDDDVRDEYWRVIRGADTNASTYRSRGVHGEHATR